MSIIYDNDIKFLFKNAWLQTIAPNYLQFTRIAYHKRERHTLPDGDFMDLDYLLNNESSKIIILIHGFEGCSHSSYIKATANYLYKNGCNVLAVNLRGCSGQDNLKPYSYHSGKTQDLKSVIDAVKLKYTDISLIGFSLGANLTLKYLADYCHETPVHRAIAISAPFDLEASAKKIVQSYISNQHFMISLKRKLEIKKRTFPEDLKDLNVKTLENIIDVDEYYTAPQHGYSSAHEFYEAASCINYVHKIITPTLILNAIDDPMLEHPTDKYFILENNPHIHLHLTQHGGHVGFMLNNFQILYHKLSLDFIQK